MLADKSLRSFQANAYLFRLQDRKEKGTACSLEGKIHTHTHTLPPSKWRETLRARSTSCIRFQLTNGMLKMENTRTEGNQFDKRERGGRGRKYLFLQEEEWWQAGGRGMGREGML